MILDTSIAIKKWQHSMHVPSGVSVRVRSSINNNNYIEHALNASSIGKALCDDEGSSGGDTNKKGEKVEVIFFKAEGMMGKGGQVGVVFAEISQKDEEVCCLRIVFLLCTNVFLLNSTIFF